MAFTVVALSPGLSTEETVRATEGGPEFVESTVAYTELLEQTGWRILEYRDLTSECARLCRQLSKSDQEREEELLSAIRQDGFEERPAVWQSRLDGIAEGLLRREFFILFNWNTICASLISNKLCVRGYFVGKCLSKDDINIRVSMVI